MNQTAKNKNSGKKFYSIELPIIKEPGRGSLCVGEIKKNIPFAIKRFYCISGVPKGSSRGNHANKDTEQAMFCLQGSVRVEVNDGKKQESVVLSEQNKGLYLGKMIWRTMNDFKEKTILLLVASKEYDKNDFITDFKEFKANVKDHTV
jgi:dTDP-4-dehydrorhamnose 3,5-epimerase-like enzyme